MEKMEIGDKLAVLLPFGSYVFAVVADVRPESVLVEYDTPNGRRDAWVDMKDLDCYYVDDDDDDD